MIQIRKTIKLLFILIYLLSPNISFANKSSAHDIQIVIKPSFELPILDSKTQKNFHVRTLRAPLKEKIDKELDYYFAGAQEISEEEKIHNYLIDRPDFNSFNKTTQYQQQKSKFIDKNFKNTLKGNNTNGSLNNRTQAKYDIKKSLKYRKQRRRNAAN